MAWLHGWAGLLLGWLLFLIFLTGTLSFFRQEITTSMQPELRRPVASSDRSLAVGLNRLSTVAPDAASWAITIPDSRSNSVRISWRVKDADSGRSAIAPRKRGQQGDGARGGGARGGGGGARRGPPELILEPGTGDLLTPRKTAGGEFLYQLHFQLHALPRMWGQWIVIIATMAMFVAIISGVITHKRIFRDMFTFRPGKGQRSWLDAHNALAVLSLPFHIVITYSGLMLLGTMILPWAGQRAFGGDAFSSYFAERRLVEARDQAIRDRLAIAHPTGQVPVRSLVRRAETEWGQQVGRISIVRPGQPGSTVELTPVMNDSLLQRSGGAAGRMVMFDAATGTVLQNDVGAPRSGVEAVERTFYSLHLARFASTGLRWIYFVMGIGGTAMVATGLILWSIKRAEKSKADRLPFGHRLVDHLNVGAVAGLMIAIPGYFWTNRLVPAAMPGREQVEIYSFFLLWLFAFLHPLMRPLKRAWLEQLAAGGMMFLAIPAINALTGGPHLGVTIPAGDWVMAGFDLTCLVTGIAMLASGRHLNNRSKSAREVETVAGRQGVPPALRSKAEPA